MIRKIFINLSTVAVAFLLVADANRETQKPPAPYDKKTPPILRLDQAYALALATLGKDTNQFYCTSANCTNPISGFPNPGGDGKGWTFEFSSTKEGEKIVVVSFAGGTATWSKSGTFGN